MFEITNIYVIASISVVGGALFGFDISSMSAQLNEDSYNCYFKSDSISFKNGKPNGCAGLSSIHQGGVTAAMPAGSWVGSLCSGFISDFMGRRFAILSGCWVWYVFLILYGVYSNMSIKYSNIPLDRFIGSTLICAAQNVGMLSVGRVINGIAVGIESSQVPVYISELAPPSKRGSLVGLQQWAITWGILIMY